jgi:hypothetical protein
VVSSELPLFFRGFVEDGEGKEKIKTHRSENAVGTKQKMKNQKPTILDMEENADPAQKRKTRKRRSKGEK